MQTKPLILHQYGDKCVAIPFQLGDFISWVIFVPCLAGKKPCAVRLPIYFALPAKHLIFCGRS